MLSLMLIIMMLFFSASPLKLSFLLLVMSVWVAISSLAISSNLFSAGAIIISFSTGMMILFCYCSSVVNFEKKNSAKQTVIWTVMPFLCFSNAEKSAEMTSMSHMTMEYQTQFLTAAIMLVVVSMLSINKSMFSPTKSSMSIY